jgi:hypothetical protein
MRYKVYELPYEIEVNHRGEVETMWVEGKKIEGSKELLQSLFSEHKKLPGFVPEQSCSTTRFKSINGTKECVCVHNAPEGEVAFEVEENNEKSIAARKSMWGTASFVREGGIVYLLTAKHVLRDLRVDGLPVTLRSIVCDKRGQVHVRQMAHFDLDEYEIFPGKQDYVYWALPQNFSASLEVSVLEFPKRLSINNPIKVFSFSSDGLHVVESSGTIKSLTPSMMTYDCSTKPGSSGGPILMGSNIIGIHTTAAVGQDVNLGIPMFTFGFKPTAKVVETVEETNRGKNKRKKKVVNFGSESTPTLSGNINVVAFAEEEDERQRQAEEDARNFEAWYGDDEGQMHLRGGCAVFDSPVCQRCVRQVGDKRFAVEISQKLWDIFHVSDLNLNEDYGADARNQYKALQFDSSRESSADSDSVVVADDVETENKLKEDLEALKIPPPPTTPEKKESSEETQDSPTLTEMLLAVVDKRLKDFKEQSVKLQLESSVAIAEKLFECLSPPDKDEKSNPSAPQEAPQLNVIGKGNKRNKKNKQKSVSVLNTEEAKPAEVPKDFPKQEVSGPSRSSKVSVDTNLRKDKKSLGGFMKWAEQQSASLI